jgi:hypothetical protein
VGAVAWFCISILGYFFIGIDAGTLVGLIFAGMTSVRNKDLVALPVLLSVAAGIGIGVRSELRDARRESA